MVLEEFIDKIICGDCLEIMPTLPDKSIDLILCDLPYGTTQCKWDTIIDLDKLWIQYKRIIKDNGAIVLTANQPFTSRLVSFNYEMYKYSWIWKKPFPTGFLNANYRPMLIFEDILVFSKMGSGAGSKNKGCMKYYPQGLIPINKKKKNKANSRGIHIHETKNVGKNNCLNSDSEYITKYTGYPNNILEFDRNIPQIHPTQKPVKLFEYLIKTYSNENDLVLDNCIGSGTTAIAALNTNRHYIGIEKEKKYVDLAEKRIAEHTQQLTFWS